MPVVELYQFRVKDPRTSKWYRTRYKLSEVEAAARYPERERLEHTLELRQVRDPGDETYGPGFMQAIGPAAQE